MPPVARLVDVHKSFGSTAALGGVDLTVEEGDVLALLGPNGAGKTTALNILLGLRRPDRGTARLFGRDPRNVEARRRVGATPQETDFPPHLRVGEVVDLVRAHYPDPADPAALLARFGLDGLERRQTGGLSGGQKRRLALALAFAGRPAFVVLDEPTTGLDVEVRRRLWEDIRHYVSDGGTVLLTTHYLEEAEALARRVVMLDRGTIRAEGTVDAIRDQVGLKKVRFADAPALSAVLPDASGLPDVVEMQRTNGRLTLYTRDADRLVRTLVDRAVPFTDLEVLPATLEEAFLVLTGGDP